VEQRASEALPVLLAALKDEDSTVRGGACTSLGKMGPAAREAVLSLRAALKDENAFVRAYAAEALWQVDRQAQAITVLRELLKEEDFRVRILAADILGRMGKDARPALPTLRAALPREIEAVRRPMAEAVKKIDPDQTAPGR
jgi:HEAT repeat protein